MGYSTSCVDQPWGHPSWPAAPSGCPLGWSLHTRSENPIRTRIPQVLLQFHNTIWSNCVPGWRRPCAAAWRSASPPAAPRTPTTSASSPPGQPQSRLQGHRLKIQLTMDKRSSIKTLKDHKVVQICSNWSNWSKFVQIGPNLSKLVQILAKSCQHYVINLQGLCKSQVHNQG